MKALLELVMRTPGVKFWWISFSTETRSLGGVLMPGIDAKHAYEGAQLLQCVPEDLTGVEAVVWGPLKIPPEDWVEGKAGGIAPCVLLTEAKLLAVGDMVKPFDFKGDA